MGVRMDRKLEERAGIDTEKNKGRRVRKVIISFFIIILIVAGSVFGYGYYTLNRISTKDVAPKKVAITKPVNILLLGVDAGDYTNYSKNDPKRSDTMMLVRYNPITNKVYILSIPRDTKVLLRGHIEKLNAAHALGGIPYTIDTIEKLLGIDINYYAELNYEGFRECIDAIGGVDITIPRDMNYDAWKINIHFKKGEIVHMDGKKAEEYVRWRKNNDGGGYAMGDLGRISTQQEFMVKVMEKMKTFEGMLKIPNLINTVSKYLKTNMSSTAMVEYALRAKGIKLNGVQREILPGEAKYIGDTSYYIWNKDKNDKFISIFRGIEPAETAASDSSSKDSNPNISSSDEKNSGDSSSSESNALVKKENIDVVILNSTGTPGLAAKYKAKLSALGYNVVNTDNYSYKKYTSTIINDYTKKGYGDVVQGDLDFGNVIIKQKKKTLASIVVILGTDSIK